MENNTLIAESVLKKFFDYAEFDKEQKTFKSNTKSYEFHNNIKRLLNAIENNYINLDAAVIYTKNIYFNYISNVEFNLLNLLENTIQYDKEKEIYDMFTSDYVKDIEIKFLNSMKKFMQLLNPNTIENDNFKNLIDNDLRKQLYTVVNDINSLKIRAYLKNNKKIKLHNYSNKLHVFPSIAICISELMKMPDSAYICFISNGNSNASFYTLMIKSNGNLISFDEMYELLYKNQYKYFRNGSSFYNSKTSIFPYSIIEGSNFDYKGYATTYNIDTNKLNFNSLEQTEIINLALLLLFVSNKLYDFDTSTLNQLYVDSLLPINTQQLINESSTSLIKLDNQLITVYNSFSINISKDDIINGNYEKFCVPDSECNVNYMKPFDSTQLIIKDYCYGFKWNYEDALKSTSYKLSLENNESGDLEYIGDIDKFKTSVYYEGRKALANYINEKIAKETEQILNIYDINRCVYETNEYWFRFLNNLSSNRKQKIFNLITKALYQALLVINNECKELKNKSNSINENNKIRYITNGKNIEINIDGHDIKCSLDSSNSIYYNDNTAIFNEINTERHRYKCAFDKTTLAIFNFRIKLYTSEIIKFVLNEDYDLLPNLMKHIYKEQYSGNSTLYLVDPCNNIKNPFDVNYSRSYYIDMHFSKVGFHKWCKDNNLPKINLSILKLRED